MIAIIAPKLWEPQDEETPASQTGGVNMEPTPPRHPSNSYAHPAEELRHFGPIIVCAHCWRMLDSQPEITPHETLPGQEGQVPAACAA
jgi:hypothetical protein